MKLSTSILLAASITGSLATVNPDEWVTYTKNLATKTIVVTRYYGSTPLEGSDYTTRTVVVNGDDGNPKYTEVITGIADAAAAATDSAAESSAESSSDPDWVTYTKNLGTTTIVVTRYYGSTALSGPKYTTRTVVKSDSDGNPQYTEVITGFADTAVTSSESSDAAVETTTATETDMSTETQKVESCGPEATSCQEHGSTTEVAETYTGGASTVGLSLGAFVIGAAALLI